MTSHTKDYYLREWQRLVSESFGPPPGFGPVPAKGLLQVRLRTPPPAPLPSETTLEEMWGGVRNHGDSAVVTMETHETQWGDMRQQNEA